MRRLQVLKAGIWEWVFCRAMPSNKIATTKNHKIALGVEHLEWFQNHFGNDTFRAVSPLRLSYDSAGKQVRA